MMRRLIETVGGGFLICLFASLASAAEKPFLASWTFDQGTNSDKTLGYFKFVPGVVGTGLRFDGQTTSVVRAAANAPRLGGAFTIEACNVPSPRPMRRATE
mgnify:CR=1 FL=1